MAKKGMTPSSIGVSLRDSFGVPQVKSVTGSKILRVLKANGTNIGYCTWRDLIEYVGAAPALPEDLYHLIKKAVSVRKHLEKHRKDKVRIHFHTAFSDCRVIGLEVPPYFDRVPNSPLGPLLQAHSPVGPHLEVRVGHCFRIGCIKIIKLTSLHLHLFVVRAAAATRDHL